MKENIIFYFIHAFPLNSNMWKSQLEFFSEKAYVVAIDLPGFGKEHHLRIKNEKPSIDEYAEFVEKIIQGISSDKKICIVGLSMGGYIAMAMALRSIVKPHYIILANTRSFPDSEEAKSKRFELIQKIEETKSIDPVIKAYIPALAPDEGELKEEVLKMARNTQWEGAKKALYAMATRGDYTEAIQKNPARTLLIAGERDPLTPPDLMKKMLGGNIKEMKIIKGAGHLTAMEKPDEFNKIIADFVFHL